MALFKRAVDVLRGDINALIEGAEDPEKMIKLYLEDARDHLLESKKAVHTTISVEKMLEARCNENQTESDKWQKRAELAVKAGNDDLAKEALMQKKKYDTNLTALQTPLANAKNQSKAALTLVDNLELRIRDVETNSAMLIARAQTAKASKKAADSLAGISSKDPFVGMKSMESKIESMEADAAASSEMAGVAANTAEKKFKDLEAGNVEDDLAALKVKVQKTA